MAWGRRCDFGCASWPDDDAYQSCPQCGEKTFRFSNLHPLDAREARAMALSLDFASYYATRCRARGETEDGDLEPTVEQHEKYDALYPGGRPDKP